MEAVPYLVEAVAPSSPGLQPVFESLAMAAFDGEELSPSLVSFADGSGLVLLPRRFIAWMGLMLNAYRHFRYEPPRRTRRFRRPPAVEHLAATMRMCLIEERLFGGRPHLSESLRRSGSQSHDVGAELRSIGAFANAINFILAHEVFHFQFVAGRGDSGVHLKREGNENPHDDEIEADRLALQVVLLETERNWLASGAPTIHPKSRQELASVVWEGISLALAGMTAWERGVFIRWGATHPETAQRMVAIERALNEFTGREDRYRLTDQFSRSLWESGFAVEPLSDREWDAFIALPDWSKDLRNELSLFHKYDALCCGRMVMDWNRVPTFPKWIQNPPGSRLECERFLEALGLGNSQRAILLDRDLPLSYSAAVDILSTAPLIREAGVDVAIGRIVSLTLVFSLFRHLHHGYDWTGRS